MRTGLPEGDLTFRDMGGQTGLPAPGHHDQLGRSHLKGKITDPTGRLGFLRNASGQLDQGTGTLQPQVKSGAACFCT